MNGGTKRKVNDAFASFLDSMLEAIAESSKDEKSRNGAKIMLYGSRIMDVAHKIQKFADPENNSITPEARQAAVHCLETAFDALNTFLTENPVPENTIFD